MKEPLPCVLASLRIPPERIARKGLALQPEAQEVVVAEIVRAKLDRGLSLDAILEVSAPPGYSEHHTGRAVDVTTIGVPPLEVEFEKTEAFRWLSSRAGEFGFALSYPAGNPNGYAYEPWHWCHHPLG